MNIHSFDLRDYLNSLGIPFWEAGPNVSKGWVGIQCLYCPDHHNHLGVHLYYKNFSCWLCHTKGSITELICDLEDTNYGAALRRLDEFQGVEQLEPEERQRLEDDGKTAVLPDGCRPLSKAHKFFLQRNRKFDPDRLVRDWGVQSGPVMGDWRHRIIIPVVVEGRTLTFVGMDHTGEKQVKYKAAAVEESFIPTSELVYGGDYAGRTAVIVEGITDVWRIGRGAVATFGMTPGPRRVAHLCRLPVEEYFVMYDGEEQADKHALVLVEQLRAANKEAHLLLLSRGYDPDMLTTDEVADLRYDLKLAAPEE